jgi:hypothetical protein
MLAARSSRIAEFNGEVALGCRAIRAPFFID